MILRRLRYIPLLLALAATACDSPSSVDDDDTEPHDFSLQVQIGEEVIRDGGPLDSDPEANRIALRDVRPDGFDGHLLLDGVLIEVRTGAAGNRVEVASTSTPDLESGSAEISVGSGGSTPFMEVSLTVTADLRGYFAGEPSGYEATVHLDGSYLAVDDSGDALDDEPISHARSVFTGVVEGSGRAADGGGIGTVTGGLVQDEPGPVPFSPDDVNREIEGGDVDGLRGQLELELGPRSGTHHPVSAVVSLRAIRE